MKQAILTLTALSALVIGFTWTPSAAADLNGDACKAKCHAEEEKCVSHCHDDECKHKCEEAEKKCSSHCH